MQAHYHVDNTTLPWRKRAAFIRHLPADSAIGAIGRDGPHWTIEAHLLDDVRMLLTMLLGIPPKNVTPYPQRPFAKDAPDPVRQKKLADARRRSQERQRMIEAGEIT